MLREAFPMRSQDAESDAQIEMFSRVGVPKEIISDQGSIFMSALISELCKCLRYRKFQLTLSSLSKRVSRKIQWYSEKGLKHLLYLNRQNGMITYHMCYLLIEKSQIRQQVSLPLNFFMLGMYEDL